MGTFVLRGTVTKKENCEDDAIKSLSISLRAAKLRRGGLSTGAMTARDVVEPKKVSDEVPYREDESATEEHAKGCEPLAGATEGKVSLATETVLT